VAKAQIQDVLGLPSTRSIANMQDAVRFFRFVVKDSNPTKQKNYDYLADGRLQPRRPISHVVQEFFGSGAAPQHQKIRWRLPFLISTFLHPTARIGLRLISQGTVMEASKFFFASGG